MPVVFNLLVSPEDVMPAAVQSTEQISIAHTDNTINRNMNNMMNTFEALTFQPNNANQHISIGY